MRPILCHIGPVPVFSYGTMIALAFLSAYLYICRLARLRDIDEDHITDIFLVIIISSIIGARFNYILSNWERYARHPEAIYRVWEGGMVYLGGYIGAMLGAMVYLRVRGLPFGVYFDMFAPGVILGQILGRLGCFFNGCCYGLTSYAHGIVFPYHREPIPKLPTQLYECVMLLVVFWLLSRIYYRNQVPGRVMAYYVYLYSINRFLIEFFRDESLKESYLFGTTLAQSTCLLMLIPAALYHWAILRAHARRDEKPAPPPLPGS